MSIKNDEYNSDPESQLKSQSESKLEAEYNYNLQINIIKKFNYNIQSNYFLGLITRCKDENYVKEFCDYYLNQGIDKIYILDDKSNNLSIYKNIDDDKVRIIYITKNSNCHNGKCSKYCTCNRVLANQIYENIRNYFEWMIYVDVDEFITTKKRLNNTLKDELLNHYQNVDSIHVPWIMMSNTNEKNPDKLLLNNIYRLNYDNKPNYKIDSKYGKDKFGKQSSGKIVQCKSIFRCKYFKSIHRNDHPSDHHPVFPTTKNIVCIESVENSKVYLNYSIYKNNLTENLINNSFLLCYHYRVVSNEHAMEKIKNNDWYKQCEYKLEHLIKNEKNLIKDETLKNKYMCFVSNHVK